MSLQIGVMLPDYMFEAQGWLLARSARLSPTRLHHSDLRERVSTCWLKKRSRKQAAVIQQRAVVVKLL